MLEHNQFLMTVSGALPLGYDPITQARTLGNATTWTYLWQLMDIHGMFCARHWIEKPQLLDLSEKKGTLSNHFKSTMVNSHVPLLNDHFISVVLAKQSNTPSPVSSFL